MLRFVLALGALLTANSVLSAPQSELQDGSKSRAGLNRTAPILLAQTISEKEAFETAKATGSVAGWQAFLKNHPTGSRSVFARAYMKRLQRSGNTNTQQTGAEIAPSAPTEKITKLTPTEQVERAYKDLRDSTVGEFSGDDDFGSG